MTIYGSVVPGASSIARDSFGSEHLTERAKHKLRVIDWHKANGTNVSMTARHFGYARKTIHKWLREYKQRGSIGLNEKSKAPKKRPVPQTSSEGVMRICQTRKQYPTWSKYKIAEILKRDYGIAVSASTVGRVLKRRGLIDKKKSTKRRKAALSPKARFPRGLSIKATGDMVQIDTKYIVVPGGRTVYQFTAIDVLTKYRVLRVYSSQSSRNGAQFLQECINEFPFEIKTVQTDNGAPFLKEFETFCKKINMPHYFTYPRSPKQNSYVEISHSADEREFYKLGNIYQDRQIMDEEIRKWQITWNTFRPHEALNYKTPIQYLEELKTKNLPTKDVIILQT